GSLSDFEEEPDPKIWDSVCSERGLCTPAECGYASEFSKHHGVCFFQRARSRILSADVVVLNHTLFFTLAGRTEDQDSHGILFENDFVIFDEAHTVEHVAARYTGASISSAQCRYSLHRLWNPKTRKGLLGMLGEGEGCQRVEIALAKCDEFFQECERAGDELAGDVSRPPGAGSPERGWSVLRVRRPEFVPDTVTLPLQRVRETVSDLIKIADDRQTSGELAECNRRLEELC